MDEHYLCSRPYKKNCSPNCFSFYSFQVIIALPMKLILRTKILKGERELLVFNLMIFVHHETT